MKLARILVAGCLLAKLVVAEPQPGPTRDWNVFLAGFTNSLFAGEYAQAAGWARANPKFAKELFALLRKAYGGPGRDAIDKQLDQRFFSLLAMELAKLGDRSALVEAKKRGWYLADLEDYQMQPPRLSSDAPGYPSVYHIGMWVSGNLQTSTALGDTPSVRGAFNNLLSLARHSREVSRRLNLAMVEDLTSGLEPLIENMSVLLEIDRGNSLAVDDRTFFEMSAKLTLAEGPFFDALRRNASPARLEKMLAEGRRKGLVEPGSLRDFVYQTHEFDLRQQRDARVSADEVLKLHDQAFGMLRGLKKLTLDDLPEQQINIWFELLTGLLKQPQVAARAQAALGDDLAFLQRALDATEDSLRLAGEWVDAGRALALWIKQKRILLKLARDYLAADRRQQCRQVLTICGDREKVRDRWQTKIAELEKAMLAAEPTTHIAALAKLGIVLERPHPHWRNGDFARLMEEWLSLEMALQEDPGTLSKLFAEADEFGQLARPILGWMAFDDPRWFYLSHLFTAKAADWQNRCTPVLASLQTDCDRLAFRPGQARLLAYRAELEKASDPEGALNHLNQAVALVEGYLNEFGASPAARAKLQDAYQPIYTALAQLQIEHGKGEQAFETLQRQMLADAVNRNAVNLAGDPRAEALQRVRGQSQELDAQFQANVQAGRDNTQTEQLLAKNKAEFHTVLTDLRQKYPNYESALAIRPINFSKSQKYLPPDAAVIQYFPTATTLYIFVVTHDKLVIRQVPLPEKQLQRDVSVLMVEMFKPMNLSRDSYSFAQPDPELARLRDALTGLHNVLITPVEGDLAGIKVLAFIPTGCLHYVPYAALARPRGQGLEFLVERFPCVNLVKSSDLDQVGRQATPGDGGLLALGNPDGSLPGAEREVGQIAQHFARSKKLLGKQATTGSLKTLDPGTSYLHMATHGVLDSFDPKKSYLLMAGGHLTMPEIYELNLDGVRLVTLSACQTAREGSNPGSELSSLAEAFSVAGTNSVVASLWSVSDAATEKLMGEFYNGLLSKHSLASSLQQAELALLKDPATAHPFFWAPFVMLGDWR
ncbi:CHAT domain-containing protein [bacterium]|nr:CHAT domain-containing protein [bacterium]